MFVLCYRNTRVPTWGECCGVVSFIEAEPKRYEKMLIPEGILYRVILLRNVFLKLWSLGISLVDILISVLPFVSVKTRRRMSFCLGRRSKCCP